MILLKKKNLAKASAVTKTSQFSLFQAPNSMQHRREVSCLKVAPLVSATGTGKNLCFCLKVVQISIPKASFLCSSVEKQIANQAINARVKKAF